jgi:superfamily I DNA/RNA helicase
VYTLLRILDMALRLDRPNVPVRDSRWIAFLLGVLRRPDVREPSARLTLATVHAVKGLEFPHVIVYEFNMFGHGFPSEGGTEQEHDLLYIGSGAAVYHRLLVPPHTEQ